jgi:hypothetical protein
MLGEGSRGVREDPEAQQQTEEGSDMPTYSHTPSVLKYKMF